MVFFFFLKLTFPKDVVHKNEWNLEKKMVRAKQSKSNMAEKGKEKGINES